MRKIAGPGHVNYTFKDYDPVTNPTGTYHTANWGNDVQDELRGIEDELSIAEAAGTNKYVLAAIKGLAIAHGKPLGELFFLNKYKAPAAFNKDSPEDYFPALCLDDGDHDIAVANWSDLVPDLRTLRAIYNEGITGEKYQFDVINWAVSSNVGTLTFADQTAEKALLSDYTEDNLVHGDFNGYRSVTLPDAIGNIPAGEYALSGIDPSARTITFPVTASDGSGGVTAIAEFYQHRIPGSSTTARVFERPGGVMVAANDADGECIAGMRRRDRGQGHWHDLKRHVAGSYPQITETSSRGVGSVSFDENHVQDPITDGVNGTPRTGKTNDPRALVGHMYIWGREYKAS